MEIDANQHAGIYAGPGCPDDVIDILACFALHVGCDKQPYAGDVEPFLGEILRNVLYRRAIVGVYGMILFIHKPLRQVGTDKAGGGFGRRFYGVVLLIASGKHSHR